MGRGNPVCKGYMEVLANWRLGIIDDPAGGLLFRVVEVVYPVSRIW